MSHHFNIMAEGERESVVDEEDNGEYDLFSRLGDIKPTPHPNNNRPVPNKLKYEFNCLCGMRIKQVGDLANHRNECEMIPMCYEDILKPTYTFIGDG